MSDNVKAAAAKADAAQKEVAANVEVVAKKASKAANDAAETIQANFKGMTYEVPAVVRELAEKNMNRARESYDRLRTAAEDATDVLEDSYSSATRGLTEMQVKALDAAKVNTNAYFDFARDLMQVKSVPEAIELQTSYARRQFDLLSGQVKEFTAIASKVASDTAEPIKAGAEKSLSAWKTLN